MSWWEGALLGLVQGLTEFLPVSSSGHLVLGDALLGLQLPGVLFEAAVHLATLFAVFWVYRERIAELVSGAFRGEAATWRYIGLLAVASVPTAVMGLAGESYLAATYEEPLVAASLLLVTGGLVLSLRWTGRTDGRPEPSPAAALLVGLAQGVAILPGISRSGSTVAMGAWRGVEVTRMAEFSFLLSVPAIGGAALLQVDEVAAGIEPALAPGLVAGVVAAAASGVVAIRLFVGLLQRGRFHLFAYYCWAVGLLYLGAAWAWPGLRG